MSPGRSGADPGETWATFSCSAEAGGDQRVLVWPGEHNQGQGPSALWEQQARDSSEELLRSRQPALPPGAATPPAGTGTSFAHF